MRDNAVLEIGYIMKSDHIDNLGYFDVAEDFLYKFDWKSCEPVGYSVIARILLQRCHYEEVMEGVFEVVVGMTGPESSRPGDTRGSDGNDTTVRRFTNVPL